MDTAENRPPRVAIIGGGITALAAAQRLAKAAPGLAQGLDVSLLIADDYAGGLLKTTRRDGFLVEHSADMFTSKQPWSLDLCREIGFESELIPTNPAQRRAYIVWRGRLHPVPAGFTLMAPSRIGPILRTGLLSLLGKMRLAGEYFVPVRRDGKEESLAEFARRRFGRETYERLIQPLIGGIYTADPELLSVAATMPEFLEMEQRHGGISRAMLKEQRGKKQRSKADEQVSGARYNLFHAPREGMSHWMQALVGQLPKPWLRYNTRVHSVGREGEQWRVTIAGRSEPEMYDAVLLALGAPPAARLLHDAHLELSTALAEIPHASSSIVILGCRLSQFSRPPEGFGCVVPMVENRRILAVSFANNKFPGRAPEDHILLRVFVGGACQPELAELSDADTYDLVRGELSEILGYHGEPVFQDIVRYQGVMPQYHLGHAQRVARIETLTAMLPGLELAGNAYHGVGIPFCIHSGQQAAERILSHS